MRSRFTKAAAAAMLLTSAALIAAGCGSDDDSTSTSGSNKLTGTITADGSSTVFPLSQALAEEFRADHQDVELSVGTSGTGGGFEKFCRGETDISNASRPIKDEEKTLCADGKVEYVELPVATDGLSVVVNKDNDFVDCLTIDQLKKIWEPDSKVAKWSDVDPDFPDDKIVLYGPGTDSGTFDYFTDEVVGEEGASRNDYTASEDDNVLVQGVAGDKGSLGYFGFGYYVENQDKLKVLGVDSGDGCVTPSAKTIDDGEYAPLARPLFIYVAKKALDNEAVVAFVDFTLENDSDLAGDVGLIAAHKDALATATSAWDAFQKPA